MRNPRDQMWLGQVDLGTKGLWRPYGRLPSETAQASALCLRRMSKTPHLQNKSDLLNIQHFKTMYFQYLAVMQKNSYFNLIFKSVPSIIKIPKFNCPDLETSGSIGKVGTIYNRAILLLAQFCYKALKY
jgi:hypothetical protein